METRIPGLSRPAAAFTCAVIASLTTLSAQSADTDRQLVSEPSTATADVDPGSLHTVEPFEGGQIVRRHAESRLASLRHTARPFGNRDLVRRTVDADPSTPTRRVTPFAGGQIVRDPLYLATTGAAVRDLPRDDRYAEPIGRASVEPFGESCDGSRSTPHLLSEHLPTLGNEKFSLEIQHVWSEAALMLLATASARIELFDGCTLLVDPTAVFAALPMSVDDDGRARLKIPVPQDRELIGLEMQAQGLVGDQEARLGAILTNGLHVRVGR